MANVTMPNGDVVAFPDDMPKAQIRSLIEKKFPNAHREAQASTGEKPYQNMGEAIGTAIGNLPGNIYESKVGLSQLAAEAVTDFIDPTKQYGNTPPLEVTPGAPIEDLLDQPAGITVPQNGIGQLLPEPVRQVVGDTAARQSLAAQLRGMEARKAQTPLDVAPGSAEEIAAGAVASTAEMVLPAAAAVAIRNPAPLVAYFTARSAGTGYNEAKAAGAPNDNARAAAGLYAAAEAVTEAIAGKVFVEGGKTLLRSILKGGAVEGLTEAATEALQAMVDAGVIGEDMTMDEVLNRVKTAGLTGAVAGAPIAAMTHGIRGAGQTEATPQMVVNEPVAPIGPDTPIEDRLALPGPGTLLALPSPEQFTPVEQPRRQPALQPRDTETRTPTVEELDAAARVAVNKTRQRETQDLLSIARETITPLGTFTPQDIMVSFGPKGKLHPGTMDSLGYITSEGAEADRRAAERQAQDVLQKVRQHRIKTGRPVEAPISIEDMARAKVPQRQIDAVIAARRPVTTGQILQPVDVRNAAAERNIAYDDGNFAELAFRTTGQRNVDRMSQAQLNALKTTLEAMPANAERVTVPVAEQSPFTDDQYGKALDAIRNQGRYTAKAVKDATGLNADKDVRAIRDAMVRRGQLVERGKNDYRLYDVLGEERQTTPDQLPPGAFKEHVIKRIPVSKVRVKVDGKSIGTFGSGTEARGKVSELRESKGPKANIVIEPAEEVAYGVLENRYDEQGNLLGQVVVDTHRDEAAAQKAAEELNAPPDTGARYTSELVQPRSGAAGERGQPSSGAAPERRVVEPAALAGRSAEILKRLNQQAKDRKLPLLGVRVQVKPKVAAPEGDAVEGMYWRKLMQLTTENLTADMTTDEIVDRLGQVMDHELIHALREAGVLGPETQGWKSIMRYARRAKRSGSNETYHQWATRSYTGIPGYGPDAIEEEAIAEAFRNWAKNRRSVVGQPATVFRQLVEWFKRLINAVPEDVFRAIETGRMVEEALTPPGSSMPRARATKEMQDAAAGIAEAQAAQNENLVRVRSREYLRARAQAREDRAGRSGPKTVLGTTPTRAFETADVDTAVARDIAERYRSTNGVRDGRLATYLPLDVDYMKRIADAQQRATHNPDADAVAKAYRALIDETKAMWRALGDVEVEAWTGDGQPYASAAAMLEDVAAGRLKLRLSDDMFGPGADNPGHPMNAASGVKTTDGRDLTNNDLFRVVHDIYGHGQSGFRDDPRGAYNAYHEHARLVSPEARRALATETLAQRAWQEFGQHLRRRDGTVPRETDVDYLKPNMKEFAEQKAFVLDDELMGADPGWALADTAADTVEDAPKFSKFADDLPGGRLYGNPNRSPGGLLSKPGTPSPAFSWDVPGNQFFGGEMAEEQLRMVREGDRGATMIYMAPEDFIALAGARGPEPGDLPDALGAIRFRGKLYTAGSHNDAMQQVVREYENDPAALAELDEITFKDIGRVYEGAFRDLNFDVQTHQFYKKKAATLAEEWAKDQVVYDAAVDKGYKFSTIPSLVVKGYAGAIRVDNTDGLHVASALRNKTPVIPVVLYPKYPDKGGLGLVTALEAGGGVRVPWPHSGRAENFPDERIDGGPKFSLNAPYGSRVPSTPPGPMYNIVQQRTDNALGNFLKNIGRSKAKVLGLPSVFDLRVKLQDKMLPVKETIEQIKENGGDITDLNDTYMLEQLYHGKVFEEIKEREDRLQVPLLDALKNAYDSPQHVTPEDFESYLYARHAPERNAYLRTRGAKDPNPAGMSDAEATAILDRFAIDGKTPTLQQLAALADRISADTTRTRVEAGLISPEAAAASPYQYYVPLRGLAEEELDPGEDPNVQTRARSGKGFSVGGREDRGVTGRKRKAGDLLGHLFLQNTEAVIRAQKNEVALSFMRLIQDNPAVGFGEVLKQAPTRRVVGASGMIQEAGDPTYRQHPDIVTAKWKGKEIIARVADPAVARAIKSDYVTTSNMLVNALGRVNRWLAMVNTSLNPEFLISNLARDLQTAGILSQQYDIPKLGRRVIGDAGKAMLGIREVLRNGTASSPWAEAFIELQQAGGTTEFLGIHDLESKVRQIRRSVTRTGLQPTARQIMDYGSKVLDFINDYNKVAENAFRLSAYVNARAAGVSVPKAAYLAKNLTINFNKGGEQKALANSLYLFYNASTQGTFVLLNGLKNKRVQKIVGGIVVASIMTDILNRALSSDDDDNGVTDYDDVPDYVLNTNFVLMDPFGIVPRTKTGGQGYFAFPMPYGFNAFWNLGRNMSASVSGSPVQSPGKAAMNSFMGFIDAFNPLGGAQDILNFISPTIADPVVEILRNKDFADNDIVPDRPTFGLPVPESQKYRSNTGPVPVWAAEQLNRLTGGNEVRKGAVDISPEHLQYAFDYATGATGKFAQRVTKFGTDTVPSMLRGDFEDVEVGDIPFARRIVGSVNSRANTERYYSVSEEVQTVAEELEMYSESGRVEDARRVVREHPTEVQLIGAFEDANKALSGLRKQLRELRATDAVPAPRKREMEEQIKSSMDRLMAQLNKLYFERKRAAAAAN